ncbi:hypothetical protein BDV95DRAFT_482506, partial [Massariosphaeria phaeospora]
CPPNLVYHPRRDFTRRISWDPLAIRVYGWPSSGGVVILEDASPADFHFLSLDRMQPPMLRHESCEAEDVFCEKLLLLGAKWWDSMARYLLLNFGDGYANIAALEESDEPLPPMRERHWVSVAWPSTGGLVVAEFDTNMWGVEIEKELVPDDVARLRLCIGMDGKAQILKERFRWTTWSSLKDYQGSTFIGCWGSKKSGEVGQFQQTWPTHLT